MLKKMSKNNGSTIQTIEAMEDPIHLLLSFPPHKTPSSIIKSFKGTSAREWFKNYPETKNDLWKGHLCSPSYDMSTVGNLSKYLGMDYIKNQRKPRV